MDKRLFIGIYPGGIVYSDRSRQTAGDYTLLGFLPYDTLELRIEPDCPDDLAVIIREDAAKIQAKRGQLFQLTVTNQTVLLGSKDKGDTHA
jgi:hypothetical protein